MIRNTSAGSPIRPISSGGREENEELADRRIVSSSIAGVSLRAERRQVSPLRSETPPLRFGPLGDCARRSAKKSAQEEESKKSPVNLYDDARNHRRCHTRTLSRKQLSTVS
jgi:hypothetical protein